MKIPLERSPWNLLCMKMSFGIGKGSPAVSTWGPMCTIGRLLIDWSLLMRRRLIIWGISPKLKGFRNKGWNSVEKGLYQGLIVNWTITRQGPGKNMRQINTITMMTKDCSENTRMAPVLDNWPKISLKTEENIILRQKIKKIVTRIWIELHIVVSNMDQEPNSFPIKS